MVELKNPVRHGQTDSAAAALGGEVEVEDLLADIFGDSGPLVGDAQDGGHALLLENDFESPPSGMACAPF